jgi:hypothetical protein
MKDEEREQNGVRDHGEVVRMTTQRGLAPPDAPPLYSEDIYERDANGVAIARPRKPDPSTDLPAERAEYVAPRTLPPTEAHKTFEMQTVKLKDEVRFPQKGIPTERNLPRVPEGSGAVAVAAAPLQETPPGPPTAADAVGSFATAAGMYKSPLATTDIPPATDENGVPINLLASASPWGAGAHTAAVEPDPGILVSGSYRKTGEPPRVFAPRPIAEGWSTKKRISLAAVAIGSPLTVLLLFALWPTGTGPGSTAAATGALGPIPTPPATEVAPPAPAAAAAMPASTSAAAAPPDAAPAATAVSTAAKTTAPAAPPTPTVELSPPAGATSKPAAPKPGGEGPQPGKPVAAPTSTPAAPATTPTAPPIPRPF